MENGAYMTSNCDCEILDAIGGVRSDVGRGEANIRDNVRHAEAGVRSDVGRSEANIRDDIGRNEANVRGDVGRNEANIRERVADADANIRDRVGLAEAGVRSEVCHEGGAIRDKLGQVDRDLFDVVGHARKEAAGGFGDVKEKVDYAGWKVSDKVSDWAEKVKDEVRGFQIASLGKLGQLGDSLSELKAQQTLGFVKLHDDIVQSSQLTQMEVKHQSERAIGATLLAKAQLAKDVVDDGNATRALINTLNLQNLQTALINQNQQLAAGGLAYHGLGLAFGGLNSAYQSANTTNAINAFQSQLTSQGIINTGTMAGTAQSATPTSIR